MAISVSFETLIHFLTTKAEIVTSHWLINDWNILRFMLLLCRMSTKQAMLCLTKITGVCFKIMQIIPGEFRWHVTAFIYKFRDNIKDKTTETLQRGFRNRNKY